MEAGSRPGLSVIICCYNSAARIEETLRYLAFQRTGQQWEIILVNNNSSDDTAEIARQYWAQYGLPAVPLSIADEPQPGLSNARTAGVARAAYNTIVFCDDDNWLPPEYLQTASQLLGEHPRTGVLGGWCEGVFEIPLEPAYEPLTGSLAVGRHGWKTGPMESVNGAGMIIRKQVYQFIAGDQRKSLLQDRRGNQLTSGGDTELCWRATYAGWEVRFDERLFFRHFMPAARLRRSYFLRLCLLNVSPVIVIMEYKQRFEAARPSYSAFKHGLMASEFKKTLHYFPRMIFGKYKFHSLIYFLQSLKITALLIIRSGVYRRYYDAVSDLRINLERGYDK